VLKRMWDLVAGNAGEIAGLSLEGEGAKGGWRNRGGRGTRACSSACGTWSPATQVCVETQGKGARECGWRGGGVRGTGAGAAGVVHFVSFSRNTKAPAEGKAGNSHQVNLCPCVNALHTGHLNRDQFVRAMFLMDGLRRGLALPTVLPPGPWPQVRGRGCVWLL
jgi:hypothetical protein